VAWFARDRPKAGLVAHAAERRFAPLANQTSLLISGWRIFYLCHLCYLWLSLHFESAQIGVHLRMT
jgi:hypothetical protein